MSSFVVEVNDFNGRQGVLDIGEGHVMTPSYVPSGEVYAAVEGVPGGDLCTEHCVSESDVWIQRSDIERARLHPEEKEAVEDAVCERMRTVSSSAGLLHFNFFTDVAGMEKDTIIELLRLQYRAGADVIEIPHAFCDTGMYERVVQYALEWQQNTWSETPLMGIASSTADLDMLTHYLPDLGGIGIDCRRFDKPLLYRVRKTLKDKDIWVHAFSAPLQYREVQNRGTLGMLINWFGVDTVSTIALSENVQRYFADFLTRMNEQGRTDILQKTRYFAPSDYSTLTYHALEKQYGWDHLLSGFCDCPVCRDLTIGDAVTGLPDIGTKNQMHRAFAYGRESYQYQQALKQNETDHYIDTKPFAAEIIRRTAGPFCGDASGE